MTKEIYHALEDPDYQDAYVDIDELRTRPNPNGGELTYRYVHGGFPGKSVKFSLCFPEKEKYTGRFFHYLSPFPGPDEEMASLTRTGQNDHIAFALEHGAYFVESNMGSAQQFGGSPEPRRVWTAFADSGGNDLRGVGLSSVSAIAEKYHGSALFQRKGGVFTSRIILNPKHEP